MVYKMLEIRRKYLNRKLMVLMKKYYKTPFIPLLFNGDIIIWRRIKKIERQLLIIITLIQKKDNIEKRKEIVYSLNSQIDYLNDKQYLEDFGELMLNYSLNNYKSD